ncbi:MAG: 2-hydroxychromene-2-carboxylate isomerase [Pseudomonadales bacterium]
MSKLEFFFDCSSPWTYLAFTGVQPIAECFGVDIIWRPILVGGVFNAVNKEVYSHRANPNPLRWRYMEKDLCDWADFYDLQIGWPENHPISSVKAMRGAYVALEQGKLVPYAETVFRHYWSELNDISDDAILSRIVEECGLPAAAFFEKIKDQRYKDKLRTSTAELIERGGFGSPTIFINDEDMYFGNDRLQLVEHALQRL